MGWLNNIGLASPGDLSILTMTKILIFLLVLIVPNGRSETGTSKYDIQAQMNRISERAEKMEKSMSPEMVQSILDELKKSCRTGREFNEGILKNISSCVETLFNATALKNEFEEAIPKGNMDTVFRDICLKWPKVRGCLKEGLDLVEECWEQGPQVSQGLDTIVQFFCGPKNDGALIALFFATGGLSCLEEHGEAVKECINEHNTEVNQENLCESVDQVRQCTAPLKKCKDSTPENLVNSMVNEVGRAIKCSQFNIESTGGVIGSRSLQDPLQVLSLVVLATFSLVLT